MHAAIRFSFSTFHDEELASGLSKDNSNSHMSLHDTERNTYRHLLLGSHCLRQMDVTDVGSLTLHVLLLSMPVLYVPVLQGTVFFPCACHNTLSEFCE